MPLPSLPFCHRTPGQFYRMLCLSTELPNLMLKYHDGEATTLLSKLLPLLSALTVKKFPLISGMNSSSFNLQTLDLVLRMSLLN